MPTGNRPALPPAPPSSSALPHSVEEEDEEEPLSLAEEEKDAEPVLPIRSNGRTVFIMQGISGSGKSTLAKRIAQDTGAAIVSADHYFERNGKFEYDSRQLGNAHRGGDRRCEERMGAD